MEIYVHMNLFIYKIESITNFSVIDPCSKGGAILTSKNKVGGVNE